ncbi:MAG: hypothetical protein Q8O41_10945 [Candidatus Methanoperedens sp.]|nr:hypothetical protein [Candidatus Methanoperedens sp.]
MYTINTSRISFTTPPDRRAALVEQAKALYSAEAPDCQKILDFVGVRLEAKPEVNLKKRKGFSVKW